MYALLIYVFMHSIDLFTYLFYYNRFICLFVCLFIYLFYLFIIIYVCITYLLIHLIQLFVFLLLFYGHLLASTPGSPGGGETGFRRTYVHAQVILGEGYSLPRTRVKLPHVCTSETRLSPSLKHLIN